METNRKAKTFKTMNSQDWRTTTVYLEPSTREGAVDVYDADGVLLGQVETFTTQSERPISRGSRIVTRGKVFTAYAATKAGRSDTDYFRQHRTQVAALRALVN